MDFYTVLDQVLALLRQRGRVSYRALKRQFQLDDETLADLIAELLYAHHPVVRRRAVASCGSVMRVQLLKVPRPCSSRKHPVPFRIHQVLRAPPLLPLRLALRRNAASSRCCSVTWSTRRFLPASSTPKTYGGRARLSGHVRRGDPAVWGGNIAQYLGDGLLIYFGYPQAHEDDAQRAVRASLGMLNAMQALNARLEQDQGIQLAVRLGIHTGLVVVGDIGGAERQEQLALGETPNIAARLQGLAVPDTVVISEATAQLVHGYFVCQALGAQVLKGLAQPLMVYRVLHESGAQTRLDVAATRGLTLLVVAGARGWLAG